MPFPVGTLLSVKGAGDTPVMQLSNNQGLVLTTGKPINLNGDQYTDVMRSDVAGLANVSKLMYFSQRSIKKDTELAPGDLVRMDGWIYYILSAKSEYTAIPYDISQNSANSVNRFARDQFGGGVLIFSSKEMMNADTYTALREILGLMARFLKHAEKGTVEKKELIACKKAQKEQHVRSRNNKSKYMALENKNKGLREALEKLQAKQQEDNVKAISQQNNIIALQKSLIALKEQHESVLGNFEATKSAKATAEEMLKRVRGGIAQCNTDLAICKSGMETAEKRHQVELLGETGQDLRKRKPQRSLGSISIPYTGGIKPYNEPGRGGLISAMGELAQKRSKNISSFNENIAKRAKYNRDTSSMFWETVRSAAMRR